MTRKAAITKEVILKAAFELLQQEGRENVTARKLAAKAGCSTQPIFRIYSNMEELEEELFQYAADYFEAYYALFPKEYEIPFANLGLAYIYFAKDNRNLFRLLFMAGNRHGKTVYELLDGKDGKVLQELERAKEYGCMDSEEMFMKMWIFIHGTAVLSLTEDLTADIGQLADLLESAFRSFLTQN